MCNICVIEFFIDSVKLEEFHGKRVLEIGSKYVNGSVRPFVEKFLQPREYIGIDLEPGRFVDIILPAENILEYFGPSSFDVVIATEVLEHVRDWRLVVNNIKKVVKTHGYVYITTRSFGFPLHAYPCDYWRFELDELKTIFSDFYIEVLKTDPCEPGVFLKARKLGNSELILDNIAPYSMLLGKKTKQIINIDDVSYLRRIFLKTLNFELGGFKPFWKIYKFFKNKSFKI